MTGYCCSSTRFTAGASLHCLIQIHYRLAITFVLLGVREADLRQRKNEIASNAEMPGWTADSIERIIAQSPVVQVSRIDDDGCVWYDASILGPDGTEEEHTLLIYHDDTWEIVDREDERAG